MPQGPACCPDCEEDWRAVCRVFSDIALEIAAEFPKIMDQWPTTAEIVAKFKRHYPPPPVDPRTRRLFEERLF